MLVMAVTYLLYPGSTFSRRPMTSSTFVEILGAGSGQVGKEPEFNLSRQRS